MAHPGDGLTCSESGHGLTCSVRCLEMVCPCLSAGRWSVPVPERAEMVCPRSGEGLSFFSDFDRLPWKLSRLGDGLSPSRSSPRTGVAWIFNPCRWLGFSIRGPNTHGARGRLVFGRFSILLSLLLVPSRIANPRHGHGVQLRATCGVLLLPSDFYSRPR